MPTYPSLPPSATDARVGGVGMVTVTLAVLAMAYGPPLDPVAMTTIILLAYALPVIALEMLVRRVHLNPSTGLDWSVPPTPDLHRVAVKLVGFFATIAVFAAGHVLFRLYDWETLTVTAAMALTAMPFLVLATFGYFYAIDGRQRDPHDAYWELGAMLLGELPAQFTPRLRNHMIAWAVKAFFLPIMLHYLMMNTTLIDTLAESFTGSALEIALGLLLMLAILDLSVAVVGYSLTCRLFDAHIRTPNTYLSAWVVTLICYFPFNSVVLSRIIDYRNENDWTDVIGDYPLLFWPWLIAILTLWALHIWSKFVYGLRWSNLTHRGIVTSGPYRFTKHPDYVSKSVYFWLTAVPFLTAVDTWTAVTSTVALAAINLIYYGRARTEELHLSEDPVYVEYALAMNERSIFRGLARRIPALRYVPPSGRRAEEDAPLPYGRLAPGE